MGRPEPARELLSTLERWRGLYTRMMETWAMIFMVLAIRVAALHQMAQRLRRGHGMSSRLAPAACSERNRLTSAVPASCGAAPFSDCCARRGARQSFSASGRAAPQPRWWICRRIGVAKSHCVAVGPPFDFAFDELHVRLRRTSLGTLGIRLTYLAEPIETYHAADLPPLLPPDGENTFVPKRREGP